jgi:hypothetical protein
VRRQRDRPVIAGDRPAGLRLAEVANDVGFPAHRWCGSVMRSSQRIVAAILMNQHLQAGTETNLTGNRVLPGARYRRVLRKEFIPRSTSLIDKYT